jgi:ADP-ribose pyrophosphatase
MRKRDTMATKKKSAAKKQQQPDRTYPKGVEVLSSKVSFEGPVFRVVTDEVREPGGEAHRRDVVRHPGSVVVLAVPAGSLDPGEDPLVGAKRELLEETGYKAKHWSKLVRYYASPGFLGEWMQIFVAESLTPGDAEPEEDEQIELFAVPLSELLREIDAGRIHDGKTIAATLLYERMRKERQRAERAAARAGGR